MKCVYIQPTYSDIGNLGGTRLDGRVDRRPVVSLGGAAAALGAKMDVNGEEVEAERCGPVGNERLAGGVPGTVGGIDATRVVADERKVSSFVYC